MSLTEKAAGLILAALLAVPFSTYLISKGRGANSLGSRVAFVLLSILLGAVAFVGTVAYAVPALNDFHSSVPSISTVITLIVLWTICLGTWFFAFRLFAQAFGKRSS